MPYHVIKNGDQFCVALEGEDTPIEGGCHMSEQEAQDHMSALYANVPDAAPQHMSRLRLNLISEIALTATGDARPLHILRTGTFTGSTGQAFTFTPEHLRAILTNFTAGKRRRPPITEKHDWGRAVGRIEKVWADAASENLYALPKWNQTGKQLLSDEVYDGFSCEIDHVAESASDLVLIGGSLTNYPAVDGLEPVTLAAPPPEGVPFAPGGARGDIPAIRPSKELDMSEPLEQTALPGVVPAAPPAPPPVAATVVLPPPPVLPTVSDAGMQQRLSAYMAEMEARNQALQEAAFTRAQAEFDRRILELEQRRSIEAFAQAKTVTTTDQPWAVPCTAQELTALLVETPAAVRGKWQTLLNRITTSGLATFDEIGSSGPGAEEADRWQAVVNAKVAAGLSRVEAIKQAAREHPALYDAQQAPKRGGR